MSDRVRAALKRELMADKNRHTYRHAMSCVEPWCTCCRACGQCGAVRYCKHDADREIAELAASSSRPTQETDT